MRNMKFGEHIPKRRVKRKRRKKERTKVHERRKGEKDKIFEYQMSWKFESFILFYFMQLKES
jgi:hypothetical protein